MVDLYKLPVERYSPRDKQSFAYTTVVKRWPTIITSIVSTLSNELHLIHMNSSQTDDHNKEEKIKEGKEIISKLSALKHDMGRNAILSPVEDDGRGNVDCYNDELSSFPEEDRRWFTMNWLFAECYLYRRLRNCFACTDHWKSYDPFFQSKAETYRSSSGAIIHLAKALNAMITQPALSEGYEVPGSPLEIAFMEMIQADLWGNATDLSLLVDLKYEDLQKLQAVGAKAQAVQAEYILRNDLHEVWTYLKSVRGGRVDIVLDNAGFELYTDFILADLLISCTPFVKEVVFHPKTIPWFVSDVLPYDFTWAIETLLNRSFFPHTTSTTDLNELETLAQRWQSHLQTGRWRLSVPPDTPLGDGQGMQAGFWTTPYAFQDLPALAPGLCEELGRSDLVIFKGDLNYRKLVGDAKWSPTTPFSTAIGPLKGRITLLSLRTNKADTIVGLPEGIAEKLDNESPDWRISGKYAEVSFCSKD